MLTSYLTDTRNLLQLPGVNSTSLYTDANLTTFINKSRGQIAGEGECIHVMGTISTAAGQNVYPFSGINVGVPATTGVKGVINLRSLSVGVASGQVWMTPRAGRNCFTQSLTTLLSSGYCSGRKEARSILSSALYSNG